MIVIVVNCVCLGGEQGNPNATQQNILLGVGVCASHNGKKWYLRETSDSLVGHAPQTRKIWHARLEMSPFWLAPSDIRISHTKVARK